MLKLPEANVAGMSRLGYFEVGKNFKNADDSVWYCTEIYHYVDPNPANKDLIFQEDHIVFLNPRTGETDEYNHQDAKIMFRAMEGNVQSPYVFGDVVTCVDPVSFDQALITNVYKYSDPKSFNIYFFYTVHLRDSTYWLPHTVLRWVRFDQAATTAPQLVEFNKFDWTQPSEEDPVEDPIEDPPVEDPPGQGAIDVWPRPDVGGPDEVPRKSQMRPQPRVVQAAGSPEQYPLDKYLEEKTDIIQRNILYAGFATLGILAINIAID